MKKSDLKQNMIVEARNGDRFIVLENVSNDQYHNAMLFISEDGWMPAADYDEKLLIPTNAGHDDYDIMRVLKWQEFKGISYLHSANDSEFEVLWERDKQVL